MTIIKSRCNALQNEFDTIDVKVMGRFIHNYKAIMRCFPFEQLKEWVTETCSKEKSMTVTNSKRLRQLYADLNAKYEKISRTVLTNGRAPSLTKDESQLLRKHIRDNCEAYDYKV